LSNLSSSAPEERRVIPQEDKDPTERPATRSPMSRAGRLSQILTSSTVNDEKKDSKLKTKLSHSLSSLEQKREEIDTKAKEGSVAPETEEALFGMLSARKKVQRAALPSDFLQAQDT